MTTLNTDQKFMIAAYPNPTNVRLILKNGEPWFVAQDVCDILGIRNATQAMAVLDEDERSMFNIGRQGEANIISESGLYTLILRSRGATTPGTPAHTFKRWVMHEVLPCIRRYGCYPRPEKGVKVYNLKPSAAKTERLERLERLYALICEEPRITIALHEVYEGPRATFFRDLHALRDRLDKTAEGLWVPKA